LHRWWFSDGWLRETLEKLPTCRNSHIDSLLPLVRTA
jgi:hypothetical protein